MWYFITEVLIAAILTVGIMFITYGREMPVELEVLSLKSKIWNELKVMDDAGILRALAVANESQKVKNFLSQFFPGVTMEVNICFEPCIVSSPFERAVTVTYFLAGDYGNFIPTVILVNAAVE